MTLVTTLQGSRKVVPMPTMTPHESLIDPPEALPLTEPGTPQISYTVQASDLPDFGPLAQSPKRYLAVLIASGLADPDVVGVFNYASYQNSSLVNSGGNNVLGYWTLVTSFYQVAADDVLEVAIWGSEGDLRTKAMFADCAKFRFGSGRDMSNLTVPAVPIWPTLTVGNPFVSSSTAAGVTLYPISRFFNISTISSMFTYPAIISVVPRDQNPAPLLNWALGFYSEGITGDLGYYPYYPAYPRATELSWRDLLVKLPSHVDYSD